MNEELLFSIICKLCNMESPPPKSERFIPYLKTKAVFLPTIFNVLG